MGERYMIRAIHPCDKSETIRPAGLFRDHFGPGRHAINFGGMNTPYFSADALAWEWSDDTEANQFRAAQEDKA